MFGEGSLAPFSMASGSSIVSTEEGSLDASATEEQSDDPDDVGTNSMESEFSSDGSSASYSGVVAPTADQLGVRINRLIESLRSSAAGGGSTEAEFPQDAEGHSLGRATHRHLRARRR